MLLLFLKLAYYNSEDLESFIVVFKIKCIDFWGSQESGSLHL